MLVPPLAKVGDEFSEVYLQCGIARETLKWVSQTNTPPVSHTHKHSPSRGKASGRAPARLYGGTECTELLHCAATLHGSTIQ
ncbi:hypothetical protein NQZ68_010867, partial [Dissostichus eleginoides]